MPPARDPWAEKLAWLMDGSIPLGRHSIGLDGVLGLVPGLGDVIGALVGLLIVVRAMQAGLPRIAIARMLTNIAIDAAVGAIPLFGDIFDFIYKSNSINLRIYEEGLRRGPSSNARHWGFFAALVMGLCAVLAVAALIAVALIRWIAHVL